jgi:DNA-binding SARP family transcriptional activator/TolB-like protein/Tfp pilus assembly protein PilF
MIELQTLGSLDLRDAGGRELRSILSQPKRFALLAYLAQAEHQRFRRRDTITALFWPELDQEHARGALRQAVRFLKRELGEGVLATRGEEEIGVEFAVLRCDARDFEQSCSAGRYRAALTAYRGDFLDGLFVSDAAPELEQWIDQERNRLRDRASVAAWALAVERRAAGDSAEAAGLARRAARFAPESETELARLIRFLDELGDRVGALAAYDEFVRHLKEEYGAAPSPETQALIRAVRERTSAIGVVPALSEPSPKVTEVSRPAASAPGAFHGPLPPAVRTGTPRRVLIALALMGVLSASLYLVAFRRTQHRVVAVLPVRIADSTDVGLADEVTDELITDLAQVSALRVINTSTMMHYRDSTPQQVARTQGVDAVVVATLRPRGDSIRLTAQLVLTGLDQAIWAESFDGDRGELFRIQRDVARQVAEHATTHVTARERLALAAGRVVPPQALDAYVRGRFWWNRRSRDNLFKAIDAYNQALEVEPTFALAYAGLGDAYAQLGYGGYLRPEDAFPKAQAAARQALTLDPTLAAPHATLGFAAMYYDWNWVVAEHEYREALAHNPSYATAHEWLGLFLAAMGRYDEAQAEERQAQVLDPLSVATAATAGWVLHYSGKQREAEEALRTALRTDSTFAIGHLYLGRVLQFQGRYDSALAHFAMTGPQRSWIPNLAGEGYVYAQLGRRQEAMAVLAQLDSISRTQYVTAYAVALVHTALGDRDKAFAWLDQAVKERTHWVLWLNRDRRWDPIRNDTRFQELTRRVHLPN